MRFWDSSALLPLYVEQASSAAVRKLHADADDMVVWVLSDVEVRSGLCRLAPQDTLAEAQVQRIVSDVEKLWRHAYVVHEVDAARRRAKRLLHLHALRAADALQLAAALIAVEDEPQGVHFVTLDERLGAAARVEGFAVVP